MGAKYQKTVDVSLEIICKRLEELSDAVTSGKERTLREFSMRVPAEVDRDADLILSGAAMRLKEQDKEIERLKSENGKLKEIERKRWESATKCFGENVKPNAQTGEEEEK